MSINLIGLVISKQLQNLAAERRRVAKVSPATRRVSNDWSGWGHTLEKGGVMWQFLETEVMADWIFCELHPDTDTHAHTLSTVCHVSDSHSCAQTNTFTLAV